MTRDYECGVVTIDEGWMMEMHISNLILAFSLSFCPSTHVIDIMMDEKGQQWNTARWKMKHEGRENKQKKSTWWLMICWSMILQIWKPETKKIKKHFFTRCYFFSVYMWQSHLAWTCHITRNNHRRSFCELTSPFVDWVNLLLYRWHDVMGFSSSASVGGLFRVDVANIVDAPANTALPHRHAVNDKLLACVSPKLSTA